MFLVKHGVPFDVAFSLEPDELLAYLIVLRGFDGYEYDFENMRFRDKE